MKNVCRSLKVVFSALVMLCLLFASCTKEDDVENPNPELLIGTWVQSDIVIQEIVPLEEETTAETELIGEIMPIHEIDSISFKTKGSGIVVSKSTDDIAGITSQLGWFTNGNRLAFELRGELTYYEKVDFSISKDSTSITFTNSMLRPDIVSMTFTRVEEEEVIVEEEEVIVE